MYIYIYMYVDSVVTCLANRPDPAQVYIDIHIDIDTYI